MSTVDAAIRVAIDRDEITQLVYAYGAALDARDLEGVLRCYTHDVEFRSGTRVLRCIDEIRSWMAEALRSGPDGIGAASTHAMAGVLVDVDGDAAHAVTTAVAFLHQGDEVVMRGLRYEDDVVRTPDGWRIRRRVHQVMWQARAPATAIAGPSQLLGRRSTEPLANGAQGR